MTDRLPVPLEDTETALLVERASATPARTGARRAVLSKIVEKDAAPLPKTLRELQGWMVRAISGTEGDAPGVDRVVTPGHTLSPRERLDIYRYGYRARLEECLLDDYPVLGEVLGHDAFEALCHEYLELHPSTSPNLNAFGRHVPEVLRVAPLTEELAPARAFLSDLARLEWALVEVIHEEVAAPLPPAKLQALPPEAWETAKFAPSPAVRLLRFDYPANPYFQKRRIAEESPPIPEAKESFTVVYRNDMTVWRMELTPAMYRVLEALLARAPIGEALARLGVDESDPEAIAEAERSVMVWFREWVSSNLFADIVTA